MLKKYGGEQADLALFILRLAVGVVFLAHGASRFQGGVESFNGFLATLGVPLPQIIGWIIAVGEPAAGALIILGLFTDYAAGLLAAVMMGAIALVKWPLGLIAAPGSRPAVGMELDLVLFAAAIAILLQGPGKYSLQEIFRRK